MKVVRYLLMLGVVPVVLASCATGEEQSEDASEAVQAEGPAQASGSAADDDEEIPPPPEPEPLPPGLAPIAAPWTGDLSGMAERRVVRFLVVQSPVLYFVDKGRELGLKG
jgi:hypothetical protein